MVELGDRTALKTLTANVVACWPAHDSYLRASFAGRPAPLLDVSEEIAGIALKLAASMEGGIEALCADYRFLCEDLVLAEEIHFRRNGRYRLNSAAAAYREVYSNDGLMRRYMNGLLLSYVLWDPHARAIAAFVRQYLPALSPGAKHLEIGPGHGLLLCLSKRYARLSSATGWDISPSSIANTRAALEAMDAQADVVLEEQDILTLQDSHAGSFDSLVMSELLEHLEQPQLALASAYRLLRPGGQLWINVPINSPAPDHIYLLNSPEEACALVEGAGFAIQVRDFFPMTGKTLEQARRQKLSISCVITATR